MTNSVILMVGTMLKLKNITANPTQSAIYGIGIFNICAAQVYCIKYTLYLKKDKASNFFLTCISICKKLKDFKIPEKVTLWKYTINAKISSNGVAHLN